MNNYHKVDLVVIPDLTLFNHQAEGITIKSSDLGLIAQNRFNHDFQPPHPSIIVEVRAVIAAYFSLKTPYATYPSTMAKFDKMLYNGDAIIC